VVVDTEGCDAKGRPIDIETTETQRQYLWFGCAEWWREDASGIDRQPKKILFSTAESFWEWCGANCPAQTTTWIIAHNWNYDAGILRAETVLPALGWECTGYINGKPPLIVRWRRGGAGMVMVDSLNWFGVSLETLGQSMGVAKLAMPDSKHPDIEEWQEYCQRDVGVVVAAVRAYRDFVLAGGYGRMQYTLASQALTAYRTRFMVADSILVHTHEDSLSLERQGYHGGRTEAFWRGPVDTSLFKLDINSMYPSIMADGRFSCYHLAYWGGEYPESWREALREDRGLVAECEVETDEPCYGYLTDKLIFPVGRFKTVLTTPEILYAVSRGHLKRVCRWACYLRRELFRDFVSHFYQARIAYREAGNDSFQYLAKILMSSLYGKFGQNGRKWETTTEYECWSTEETIHENPDGSLVQLRLRLGLTEILKTDGESENSCPIIAAEITAAARMQLWEYIRCADGDGQHTYYCDTDSVIVDSTGYARLEAAGHCHPTALGKLKLEATSETGEYWAPKHYRFGDETKIKGVRKKARITQGVGGQVSAEQAQFASWDWHLAHGDTDGVLVRHISKTVSGENTKRIGTETGWTKPIKIG
jgi:hypothetical protein